MAALRVRSRHWFFGARLVLDGQAAPETLMQMVKATLRANPNNSVIGFKDNSSAIRRVSLARPAGSSGRDPGLSATLDTSSGWTSTERGCT